MLVAASAYAARLIKIETKDFNSKQVAFIFHHPDRQNLQITTIGKQVVVTSQSPIQLTQVNSSAFSKFASNLQSSKSETGFSFNFLGEYSNFHKIDGERFTAIEFDILGQNSEEVSSASSAVKATVLDKSLDKPIVKPSEIHLTRKGDDIMIHFPWRKDVGAAAFIKDQYLWVIFDKYKKFILDAKDPVIESVSQLQDGQKTILKFKLLGQRNVKFNKDDTGVIVTLGDAQDDSSLGKNINIMPYELGNKILIEAQDTKMYKLYDQGSNQHLYVFTLQNNSKIHKFIDKKKYQILKTGQGVAISSRDQDVQIDKHERGLLVGVKGRIIDPNLLFSDIENTKDLLPVCNLETKSQNFTIEKSKLESVLTKNLPEKEMYQNMMQLTKLYFCHGMYQESLGALDVTSIKYHDLFNKDLKAYLLTAVNLSLINQNSRAKDIYEQIFSKLPEEKSYPHVALWNSYNDFALDNRNSINLLDNITIINQYPDELYFKVALGGIESYIKDNSAENAHKVYNLLRSTQDPKIQNNLLFLKAQIAALKNNNALAKDGYKKVIQNSKDDNFNLLRASIKLVELEYLDKEISPQDAVDVLNDLRFIWRGDALEQELLLNLAFYYQELNDKINVLRTYKYIESSFENEFLDLEIATKAQSIAKEIFLSDNTKSDMENVSLFLEFENYIKLDENGIKIVMQTAKRMSDLTLHKSAIELLTKYMDKTNKVDKLEFADLIAQNYLDIQNPQEAIRVLEATDLANNLFAEYTKRARLKALGYEALNQFQKAASYISQDNSIESYPIKKRIYFKAGQWQKFIDLIEESVLDSMQDNIDNNKQMSRDIVMLAISYVSLDQKENLEMLVDYLKKSPNLQNSIKNFSSLAKSQSENLNIEDIQKFIDSYKEIL